MSTKKKSMKKSEKPVVFYKIVTFSRPLSCDFKAQLSLPFTNSLKDSEIWCQTPLKWAECVPQALNSLTRKDQASMRTFPRDQQLTHSWSPSEQKYKTPSHHTREELTKLLLKTLPLFLWELLGELVFGRLVKVLQGELKAFLKEAGADARVPDGPISQT